MEMHVNDQLAWQTHVDSAITKAICEKKPCSVIHDLITINLGSDFSAPVTQHAHSQFQCFCLYCRVPNLFKNCFCVQQEASENILCQRRYWILNDVLCSAIKEDHYDLVDYVLKGHLFNQDVNLAAISNHHPSPLIVAMKKSNLNIIHRLVSKHKANVDGKGSDNWLTYSPAEEDRYGEMTPIELAFYLDNSKILEHLVNYSKEEIRSRWAWCTLSLLNLACFHGALNCVQFLTQSDIGIDINATNFFPNYRDIGLGGVNYIWRPQKYTPLIVAAGTCSKLVQLLLDKGASMTSVEDNTTLHGAFQFWGYNHVHFPKDLPEIVDILIQAGVDLTTKNEAGFTSLECLFHHIRYLRWSVHEAGDKDYPMHRENIVISVRKLVEYNNKIGSKGENRLYLNGSIITDTIYSLWDNGPASWILGKRMYYEVGIDADVRLLHKIAELLFSGNVCMTNMSNYKIPKHQLSFAFPDNLLGTYNTGISYSMTDRLFYMFSDVSVIAKLKRLLEMDPERYTATFHALQHLLVMYVLNGDKITRIDVVAELLVVNLEGYKSFLSAAMVVLDHMTRTNLLKDLNAVLSHWRRRIGSLDRETMCTISEYLDNLHFSWPLKTLCKSVVIECLGPKCYTKLDILPLPSVLVSYLKLS